LFEVGATGRGQKAPPITDLPALANDLVALGGHFYAVLSLAFATSGLRR
jgi:hypothetical protein